METDCKSNTYTVLDSARLPIAVMEGEDKILRYVNAAFSALMCTSVERLIGMPFEQLIPDDEICLLLLDEVYRSGKCETHTRQLNAQPHSLYWSYEIWPTYGDLRDGTKPVGLVLQVIEMGSLQSQTALMNEALLLSAVRHHELMEEADTLNRKLEAEIRERQRVEIENEQLAYYDALTDLPNRRLLLDRLHRAILACRRTMHHGAILFVDLDRFKIVNDTRGHHFGDLLLHQVAHRLKLSVREGDTVARLGGDEFVIVLEDLSEDAAEANEQAEKIGTKVLGLLQPPYSLEEHQHYCTGSIGITVFGKSPESVDGLLKQADLAQYRAKAAGGRTIRFFDPEMQAKAVERAELDIELRNAIQEKQFILHYQPQVDSEGYLCGVEALLRWSHPRRGLLLPSDFIFYAEDHGLIETMGLWIIDTACRQLREWGRKPETSHLTIAVNVSYREFRHPEFVDRVLSIIDETNVNPTKLILELTERVAFDSLEETFTKMSALTSHGLSFALDDFGMGFSSLGCIKNLPVSQVKIDRSFVCDILKSQSDAVIASAILSLARNLGLSAVAEGVETEEQFTFLATYGCRIFQGFFFGAPQPIDHLVVDRRKMGS